MGDGWEGSRGKGGREERRRRGGGTYSGSAELAEKREERKIRDEAEVEDRMLIK
jgi:hypothetical protein